MESLIHCSLRHISHENTPCLVTSPEPEPSPGVGGEVRGNSTPSPVTRTLAPEIFVSPPTENIWSQEKYVH